MTVTDRPSLPRRLIGFAIELAAVLFGFAALSGLLH